MIIQSLFIPGVGVGKAGLTTQTLEHAKSHVENNSYLLARASGPQAFLWNGRHKFEEAESDSTLCALDRFEKLGATNDAEGATRSLKLIDVRLGDDGELLEIMPLVCVDSSCSDWITERPHLHLPRIFRCNPFASRQHSTPLPPHPAYR